MPIYEYCCDACGYTLETLQKISEPPLTDCPECGKPALKKLVSAAAFRLKGGGWYETDFKTGSKKNVAQADTGAKAEGKTDKADKTDKKAAGKDKTGGATTAGNTAAGKKASSN
jgi:putative FmdB family regulatory protein